MATDFTYGGKQIVSGGPFKPGGKDMPSDARTRVDCYADIATIPNPYVGLKITVKVDETNNNKMTDYIVKSLKANSIGAANSLIDEVERYVDYLGASSNSGNVSQEDIKAAVNDYLEENPVQSGATVEQAAQIEANKTAIGDENSGLIKEVNDIKNTELQNLNTAILRVNETVGNKSELPVGDENIIASINRIDNKQFDSVTDEQAQQLQTAYKHSQSVHVQASDIPSKTSDLTNDSNFVTEVEMNSALSSKANTEDIPSLNGYATETFVTNKIAEAQLGGGEVDTTSFATDLSLSGSSLQLKNSSGNLIGNAIELPSGSAGSGLTSEQSNQLTTAYEHSQSPHVQSSDIPTTISELENDVDYASKTYVTQAISTVTTGEGNSSHTHSNINILNTITREQVYLTQSEYNLLTNEEKANETKVYNIINNEETFALQLDGNELNLIRNGEIISTVTLNITGGSGNTPTVSYGSISLEGTTLTVNENTTNSFNVKLTSAPSETQTVNIVCSNENIVLSNSTLQFNSSNYNVNQAVEFTVPDDSLTENYTFTFTLSSTNVASKTLTVTVTNNDFDSKIVDGAYYSYTPNTFTASSSTWSNGITEHTNDLTATGCSLTEDGYVLVPNSLSIKRIMTGVAPGSYTAELLIKNIASFSGTTPILSVGNPTSDGLNVLGRATGTIELANKSQQVTSDTFNLSDFASDSHLHIFIINDTVNSIAKLFINGRTTNTIPSATTTSNSNFVLNCVSGAMKSVNLYIKALRFYTKALTDAEVLQNYNYEKSAL